MKNTHIFKEKAEGYSQKIGLEIKGSVIKILKKGSVKSPPGFLSCKL